MNIQEEYDKIYLFFKKTSEAFDELDWDGKKLKVLLSDKIIEVYSKEDVKQWKILN